MEIDGIKIKTMLLNHPGHCLGYRVEYKKKSICYVTDNELYPESNQFHNKFYLNQLKDFVADTDILITDCTYTDEELLLWNVLLLISPSVLLRRMP